jgi:hypothetical protein
LFQRAIRNNIHACMYVVKKRLSTVLCGNIWGKRCQPRSLSSRLERMRPANAC